MGQGIPCVMCDHQEKAGWKRSVPGGGIHELRVLFWSGRGAPVMRRGRKECPGGMRAGRCAGLCAAARVTQQGMRRQPMAERGSRLRGVGGDRERPPTGEGGRPGKQRGDKTCSADRIDGFHDIGAAPVRGDLSVPAGGEGGVAVVEPGSGNHTGTEPPRQLPDDEVFRSRGGEGGLLQKALCQVPGEQVAGPPLGAPRRLTDISPTSSACA